MLSKRIVGMLLLGVLVLSGCTDREQLMQGVLESNSRVDRVHNGLLESKKAGIPLESAISSMFSNGTLGELTSKEGVNGKGYVPYEIQNTTSDMAQRITDYIKDNQQEVTSRETFVSNVFSVRYFIDDSTGRVEQLFFLQLPNGYTGGFVVNWLGGVYLETSNLN
jgi:hypothetical protein